MVSRAVINLNLYGHIAEKYNPKYGYDPGVKPTFPPIIDENATMEELTVWHDWWRRDGQVFHLLFSRLSPNARSQLSDAGAAHHDRHTAHELFQELVQLFGGMDYNTAAVIREDLTNLLCTPSQVTNYVVCWRTGLNQLHSTGHPFDHADSIHIFVNHLPLGSAYDMVHQHVLHELGATKTPAQLPSFESVVNCVWNINLNKSSFQPARSHHNNITTSTMSPKDTHVPTPTPNSSTTSQPRPPCSANFCTICHTTGHVANDHNKPGGVKESGPTDRGKQLMPRAYIADLEVDVAMDGDPDSMTDSSLSTALAVVDDDSSIPFAALGTTYFVPPTTTSVVNNDIFFDLYCSSVMSFAFSTLEDLDSTLCPSMVSNLYNTILDSGCTNHIIKDHSLFWTYHTSLAVLVKTANCGILETLAKGDVKFRIRCGQHSIVFVLCDCLHAPTALINLLSVGAMQEQQMRIHFNEDDTIIHFPSNHPSLAGLSFTATVIRCLSFLDCNFVLPNIQVSDGSEVAFPTFLVVEKTPILWHCHFGHLSLDATWALLMKDYATGVNWTGPLDLSEQCVPCLTGKHPQIPYPNHGHHALAVCKLLHMDTCRPFPVLTPHKKSSFWAILDDKSNYGHVELLSAKSNVYSAYTKVEALWEAKSGNRVVTICMDGAKEFSCGKLGQHLTSRGIVMQITAPYMLTLKMARLNILFTHSKMDFKPLLLIQVSPCLFGVMLH